MTLYIGDPPKYLDSVHPPMYWKGMKVPFAFGSLKVKMQLVHFSYC